MQHLDRPARGQCLTCGSHVTRQFEKTHGDEDDRAHRCTNCDSVPRLARGSAAGHDVDHKDPLEHPDRFGSGHEDIDANVRAAIDVSLGGGA